MPLPPEPGDTLASIYVASGPKIEPQLCNLWGVVNKQEGKISVAQHKTGTRLLIPMHPKLSEIIEATPSNDLTFLISGHGQPFASANSFSNAMSRWAEEAGLDGCPLHGLRKACCRCLAEAGCSASEIMAISGHKSLAERYVKAASQTLMAEAAMEKVSRT